MPKIRQRFFAEHRHGGLFEQVARDGVRYDTGIRGGQEISPFMTGDCQAHHHRPDP